MASKHALILRMYYYCKAFYLRFWYKRVISALNSLCFIKMVYLIGPDGLVNRRFSKALVA